jgi:hypothetical protein
MSYSISPDSRFFHAKLYLRLCYGLLQRGTQEIASPVLSFRVIGFTSLLHFSHSISSDSRSHHAKLHPRVRHGLFKKELQAIAVPGPSFHIENITSPALLHVTYELARISSVSRQIGHPYLSPPTQEWTAISCGPWAIVSCPVHRLLPLHQSRIRSRLNHIRFTSDCTPVFATAYSRG